VVLSIVALWVHHTHTHTHTHALTNTHTAADELERDADTFIDVFTS